jgi:hypothetical protein
MQQAVTYARNHTFERSAVQDERNILQSVLDRGMGKLSYGQARDEFERRVANGEFRKLEDDTGRAAPQYTTAEMVRLEKEVIGRMQEGNVRGPRDPMLVSEEQRIGIENRHPELNVSQRQAVNEVFRSREKIVGIDGIAGAGKTTALDRIQFTAPNQELKIANRELGNIERISPNGAMTFKLESGREMSFDPQRHPHLDHGYAVTSYSGQGQTTDRVLIHVDTELGAKDLLNNRMAYVSVSRGQWDAQIFTNDRSTMKEALSRDVSHETAHKPDRGISPTQEDVAQSPQPARTQGMDVGIGV